MAVIAREKSLRQQPDRARCNDRHAQVVSAARASRHLGLGPARRAHTDRRQAQRPRRAGRRANHQDEHALHLRSRDRRTAVRARGTTGAAERCAGRSDVADAAVPAQTPAAVPNDIRSRSRLLYADARARGVLPGALEREQDVHEGHVHAAWSRGDDGDVSEHAWRGELERALVRSCARPRVFEHHESRSGGANGAPDARRRRHGWSTSGPRRGNGRSDASGIWRAEFRVRRHPSASSWPSM